VIVFNSSQSLVKLGKALFSHSAAHFFSHIQRAQLSYQSAIGGENLKQKTKTIRNKPNQAHQANAYLANAVFGCVLVQNTLLLTLGIPQQVFRGDNFIRLSIFLQTPHLFHHEVSSFAE
jgi:hypothetical protein